MKLDTVNNYAKKKRNQGMTLTCSDVVDVTVSDATSSHPLP